MLRVVALSDNVGSWHKLRGINPTPLLGWKRGECGFTCTRLDDALAQDYSQMALKLLLDFKSKGGFTCMPSG